MSESTQTQATEADPVSQEQGSEDEAVAAMLKGTTQEDQPADEATTDEPDPADESAEESTEEAEEADPEEDKDAEQLIEVEGKEVPLSEVKKGYLRQADYSRAMNVASETKKAYEQRLEVVESLEKSAEKRGEALAEVKLIDARIKTFDGIDWAKARTENPGQAAMAAVELMTLKDQRKDAVQAAANVAREITEGNNKLLETARGDMDAVLKKDLKGWGDELGTKLTRYAQEHGVSLKTLQQLTDPGVVIALDKARRYDELQANKAAIKAKAQPAPQVVKPGAPRKPDGKSDAMARLRKSNSTEDAIAAFMSR